MKISLVFALFAALGALASDVRGGQDPENSRIEEGPIPEIPKDQLPPLTGKPPDPAREQYRRETVWVSIDERVQPKDPPAYTPSSPVLEIYISEYFRRAGFQVASRPEDAEYLIQGSFRAKYLKDMTFLDQALAHEYSGDVNLTVRGKREEELENVEVQDFLKVGILSRKDREKEPDEALITDMRRHLAKIVWERLYYTGKVFADKEIPILISSLASDDLESEAPLQADHAIKALVARRLEAVPYLLEALSDERMVRVNARYPGLTIQNADSLRIYHIADKALEEIFQKVSRMNLETPANLRFLIIRGWENEWKRFCPSFRESQKSLKTEKLKKAASSPTQ